MHDILYAIIKKTKLAGMEDKRSNPIIDTRKRGSHSEKVMSIYSKNHVIINE